jgi:hypothetical protein
MRPQLRRRQHSPRPLIWLLARIVEEDFGFDIMVLTRIEVARDDEQLALMRRAGVTQIYQGYESVQPETLVGYEKKQTLEKIVATIDKLHAYGFRISGSFVVGADTDARHDRRTVVRARSAAHAYFFPSGATPRQIRGYGAIVRDTQLSSAVKRDGTRLPSAAAPSSAP